MPNHPIGDAASQRPPYPSSVPLSHDDQARPSASASATISSAGGRSSLKWTVATVPPLMITRWRDGILLRGERAADRGPAG